MLKTLVKYRMEINEHKWIHEIILQNLKIQISWKTSSFAYMLQSNNFEFLDIILLKTSIKSRKIFQLSTFGDIESLTIMNGPRYALPWGMK